jgi:hypothetical protein
MNNTTEYDSMLENIEEIQIPPGIPQSIIVRVIETCGVNYEIKKDELFDREYPILYGEKENIENAKKYFILLTEAKLALRDIARLARRFKTKVRVYSEDEELNYILGLVSDDITNKDKIEIINHKLDSEDFEIINICGKSVYIYV